MHRIDVRRSSEFQPEIKLDDYFIVSGEGAKRLATKYDLNGEDWHVLFTILANIRFGNTCSIPRRELAQIANKKPQNLDRALRRLQGMNLTRRTIRNGVRVIEVNPNYFWKGYRHQRPRAIKNW